MKLVTLLCLLAISITAPQEAKKAGKVSTRADMLEKAKAGPEHEKLAKCAGAWELEVKMIGSKSPPMKCSADNRMIVGGRFLQVQYLPKEKEGGTEGMFTIGFDRRHQHFTLIAVDDFGTYSVSSQGKADAQTGKIKMYGKDDDPMMKAMGFTKEFVHVLDLRGPDEFAVEVFFVDTRTPERKELKAMEFEFKRKK